MPLEPLLPDQMLEDFVRTGTDLDELGIPEMPFHGIIPHVAVAPVALNGIQGRLGQRIGCVQLGHIGAQGNVQPVIQLMGSVVGHQAHEVDAGHHVASHVLYTRYIGQGLPESDSSRNIFSSSIERRPCLPDSASRNAQSLDIQCIG